jgi:hypothetical protein
MYPFTMLPVPPFTFGKLGTELAGFLKLLIKLINLKPTAEFIPKKKQK